MQLVSIKTEKEKETLGDFSPKVLNFRKVFVIAPIVV